MLTGKNPQKICRLIRNCDTNTPVAPMAVWIKSQGYWEP